MSVHIDRHYAERRRVNEKRDIEHAANSPSMGKGPKGVTRMDVVAFGVITHNELLVLMIEIGGMGLLARIVQR